MSRSGGRGRTARDALVTGMGFCLPGQPGQGPVITADQLWDVASTGTSCLRWVGGYYGLTDLTEQAFTARLPGVAGFIADNLNDTHRLGLVSLYEACADAKLDIEAGELAGAAILVGRGGIDSNVTSYLALRDADLSRVTSVADTVRARGDRHLVVGRCARAVGGRPVDRAVLHGGLRVLVDLRPARPCP